MRTFVAMITFPIAKINLGLNVVEKRPDGYHNLETVFYPVQIKDALEVYEMDKDFPSPVNSSPSPASSRRRLLTRPATSTT